MPPVVQDAILTYRQGEQDVQLAVDSAGWFAWLETASSFAFTSAAGHFTARREQSGHQRGGWYWKAYRKRHGKLASRYLGKSATAHTRTVTRGRRSLSRHCRHKDHRRQRSRCAGAARPTRSARILRKLPCLPQSCICPLPVHSSWHAHTLSRSFTPAWLAR